MPGFSFQSDISALGSIATIFLIGGFIAGRDRYTGHQGCHYRQRSQNDSLRRPNDSIGHRRSAI